MNYSLRAPALAILAALLAAVLTAATVFGVSYLLYPVNAVHVDGARVFPEPLVTDAVPKRASLLTVNAAALERKAESNPWVESAEVTRNWESGIVAVEVEERRPVVDAEVDGRQRVLAADGTELPGLGGADGLAKVEMDGDQLGDVLEFGRVLKTNGVALDSVDGVGPGGYEATVEGRGVVFSGGSTGDLAGQARALPDVMARHPEAPLFDLRSPDRIVVADSRPSYEGRGGLGAGGG